jgi:hypothetical protein
LEKSGDYETKRGAKDCARDHAMQKHRALVQVSVRGVLLLAAKKLV